MTTAVAEKTGSAEGTGAGTGAGSQGNQGSQGGQGAAPAGQGQGGQQGQGAEGGQGDAGKTGDGKGGQGADGKAGKGTILGGEPSKEGTGASGAPEKYTDFTLPEGLTINPKVMDGFRALAKESGLSQDAAQKFVDFQAQNVKDEIDGRMAEFEKQITDWRAETEKLFGHDATVKFGIAAKAVERFGSPQLRTLLNESGLGNHPELVNFFYKVGSKISEDQPVDGKSAGGQGKSTAELMYGEKMGSKK